MVFQSNRGLNLVDQDCSVKTLTVEDYCKWYDLHLIDTDGTVTNTEALPYNETVDAVFNDNWLDHCITPKGFIEVAKVLGAKVSKKGYAAVISMYRENYLESDTEPIPEYHEPSKELLEKLLIEWGTM